MKRISSNLIANLFKCSVFIENLNKLNKFISNLLSFLSSFRLFNTSEMEGKRNCEWMSWKSFREKPIMCSLHFSLVAFSWDSIQQSFWVNLSEWTRVSSSASSYLKSNSELVFHNCSNLLKIKKKIKVNSIERQDFPVEKWNKINRKLNNYRKFWIEN